MHTSREVPLKDLSEGESYTWDEIKFLKERWSESDAEAVSEWVEAGAQESERPIFVPRISYSERGAQVPDLRGIRLTLTKPRSENDRRVGLSDQHLEHADLSSAHLEHADLSHAHLEHAVLFEAHLDHAQLAAAHLEHAVLLLAHLEGANLAWAHLEHADLSVAHLEDAVLLVAHLEHAQLMGAHLEHAQLTGAHLEHADLSEAYLEHAHLSQAHLEHASLWAAHLGQADLSYAHLQHAVLTMAHLEHADLLDADIVGANLSAVYLDGTGFRNVVWREKGSPGPSPDCFRDFDVRGIRYSDPLFDQFVRQSEFIRRCSETWPKPVFLAWELTCNCGRSLWRWLFSCAVVTFLFALVYLWSWALGLQLLKVHAPGGEGSLLAYLYFSVVTFSTLGFGDVTPAHCLGEVLVILEVLIGYIFLGGLISIFTMKLLPPR